jgi:3-hydroxyisobutyrate dehydrogenase-like beta-hydroxyacid dehydrogenase
LKDVGYAIDLGKNGGLNLTGAETSRALLQKAIDAGFDQDYWPVLLKVIEQN